MAGLWQRVRVVLSGWRIVSGASGVRGGRWLERWLDRWLLLLLFFFVEAYSSWRRLRTAAVAIGVWRRRVHGAHRRVTAAAAVAIVVAATIGTGLTKCGGMRAKKMIQRATYFFLGFQPLNSGLFFRNFCYIFFTKSKNNQIIRQIRKTEFRASLVRIPNVLYNNIMHIPKYYCRKGRNSKAWKKGNNIRLRWSWQRFTKTETKWDRRFFNTFLNKFETGILN